MRLATFVIALLLLAGSVDPTRNSFIVLTVFAGLAAVRWRPWRLFDMEPVLDVRIVPFVLALLLLAGVIDPTRGAFIGLTVAAGVALVMPHAFGFGHWSRYDWPMGRGMRFYARRHRGYWRTGWDGDDWR